MLFEKVDNSNLESPPEVTPKAILRQNKGQLIVEYVLLIFIVVTACALLTRMLVGRGDGNNGVVITKWSQLLNMVGQDVGD